MLTQLLLSITTKVYRNRTYTDAVKKDTRIITTTTNVNRLTYKDGTTEDVTVGSTTVAGDWTTTQLSESTRSENILQSETTTNRVVTTSDSGTEISRVTSSNTYTDNDLETANPSTTVQTTHRVQ